MGRVINNAGRISIKGSTNTPESQKRHLEAEGVVVTKDLEIDIEKYRWCPLPEELEKFGLDDEYIARIVEKYLI